MSDTPIPPRGREPRPSRAGARPASTRGRHVEKQASVTRWVLLGAGLLVVAALVYFFGFREQQGLVEEFTPSSFGDPLPTQDPAASRPGEKFPDQGQGHVAEGTSVTYNSNPPSSGQHYDRWADWGIYTALVEANGSPLRDERLVHNLEHGGVVIHYDPDDISGGTLEQLQAQVRELAEINPRIMLVPRQDFGAALALTAWGYVQKLPGYDAAAVRAFYDAHIARGPECQNGACPP